jgi:hypothetical protein
VRVYTYDWVHLFVVAVMGASLTMALTTRTLWPIFPTVTRAAAPRKFWLGVGLYSFFVVSFFVGLILVLLGKIPIE